MHFSYFQKQHKCTIGQGIGLCQLMRIYFRTYLPNFILIRFETVEPWAFLKRSAEQEAQE